MTKLDARFTQELVKVLAANLLEQGYLSDDDLADGHTCVSKMKELLQDMDIIPVIDHTHSLLDHATRFANSDETDIAIVFYATYFEHALNGVIDSTLMKKRIGIKSKNELIRAVNIAGKCGWLLEVLELPKFNDHHRKVIIEVSSARNAFVHYKWNTEKSQPNTTGNKTTDLLKEAGKTASYMKRYDSRVRYKGKKGRLKKTLTRS